MEYEDRVCRLAREYERQEEAIQKDMQEAQNISFREYLMGVWLPPPPPPLEVVVEATHLIGS